MLIKNTLYIYLKLDLLNVYFKEEFIMKKLKFLAIFLFSAVIGSQDILNDIKSTLNNIKGQTIYVRDYSMYQRLKSLGASDITNSSDEIVKAAKAKYGYNIYMVRF